MLKEERSLILGEIQEVRYVKKKRKQTKLSFLVPLIFSGRINNVGLGSPSFDAAV